MQLRPAIGDWRLFAGRFVAASAVLLVLWQLSLYLAAVVENRQYRVVMAEAVHRAQHDVSRSIAGYTADLMILAKNGRLRALAGGDTSQYPATVEDFGAFVSEKADIAQLRFIDARGREVVRIDRHGVDTVVVPSGMLQDKSNRYYFKDSINLPEGTIYASPIDLNTEHDAIELPWRPMFRLATSIQPAGPESRGIVIINIDASELIDEVRQAQPTEDDVIQLVNSDGYWLAGAPTDRLWGFMFGRDTTMATQAPEIWEKLSGAEQGEFDAGGSHYLYRNFRPGRDLAGVDDVAAAGSGEIGWTFLASVPNVSLPSTWRWHHLPVAFGGLCVTALITMGWTQSTAAKRKAEAEKRRTEDEMMRNKRLASLGGLVAGVAHELNTPIGSAVTIASTLGESADAFARSVESGQVKRSELQRFVDDLRAGTAMVQRNLERADELIGHFKQVAVDQTSERRRDFRLDDYVLDVIGSIAPQFKGSGIRIENEVRTSGTLNTYPGPLAQVLINLVTNARVHAFDEGEKGVITISARDVDSNRIEIVVRDSGKGVPEEDLKNIFEPFFTTRLGSGGSGLGLSIVFNIVKNVLGGSITAASTVGKGTSMIIRMPRTAPAGNDAPDYRSYHVDKHAA